MASQPLHLQKLYLQLRDRAYRLLANREHSAWELRRKLKSAKPKPKAKSESEAEVLDPEEFSPLKFDAEKDSREAEQPMPLDFTQASDSPNNQSDEEKVEQEASDKEAVDKETMDYLIDRLLSDLVGEGAQSDIRFAEQRCRWRYQNGTGPLKLEYELADHQIPKSLIAQVMADYDKKWQDLADKVLRKKFGTATPANYSEWAKQARFLQQRGFSQDQIKPYVE